MKCVIPICDGDDSASLHRFPGKSDMRERWVSAINAALECDLAEMVPNYGARRVCAKHFKPECFSLFGTRTRLQSSAVPTIFNDSRGDEVEIKSFGEEPYDKSTSGPRKQGSLFKSQTQQTRDSVLMPPAMPLPGNFRDACRLCFATETLEPLYSGLIVAREEMLDRIYLCTGILIVPKPKETASICKRCEQTIKTFFIFRQQVSSNNLAYIEKKATDEAIARKDAFFKNVRRRKIAGLLTKVPKTKTNAPKLLRVEWHEQDNVTRPAPEPIPNPLDCDLEIKAEPEDTANVCVTKTEQIELKMTVECDAAFCGKTSTDEQPGGELPEEKSWTCHRCDERFCYKFECAKHLLQKHREKVDAIKIQLNLDELNTNILLMMSERM